jgi:SAM-dependent methyltransferase
MAGRDYWLSIANATDADDLREHILTGFKSGKPFTPYVPTISLPSPLDRVLDFGCGVGRTFPYLKRIARHVTGFDLPPMIERCRMLASEPADELLDDWAVARVARFDLIVAVLVLQHIEPAACAAYLRDFAKMTPAVYLLSRVDSDFGTNVFAEAAATGLFEASECIEVDHDPDTHQLRVLGTVSFDEVCRPRTSGHYEVVLRSR